MRRPLVSIICVALVAAACSSPQDEEVASYDGNVLTVGDVSALFASESIPIDIDFRQAAFRLVALDILEAAYEQDFATEVDEADVDARFEALLADIEGQGLTLADYFGYADAAEGMVRFDARLSAIRDGVIAEQVVDPDLISDLQTALAADPAIFTGVCVRQIRTETIEEADAVVTRIEAGEDFGAVADEVSLDDSAGGDLGCAAPGDYVAPFAEATMTAPIGELYGPVATTYGFHVLIVDQRVTPTAEELAADPGYYLTQDQLDALWFDWLNAEIAAADVEVNPKFGVWDAETLQIVAPPTE
ncbi:MAG: peptidylprolyl isomerase [Actinobacteria bacterium]|nr:peptidylprolyl isomerase [Actinomycetota bacterium]MBU1492949.1 peptidylprolyl isomerase [Actinomycetota bacterium]MBU1865744.1 peptidylprolyl isomerase [Actinomycetota bacterium]